ncbi:collagenase-like PrtC family protease [Inhella inkyongensis]|uniref:Ubiquinone biosynthesis protein UbiV n=1 Tax=Inhella inkyongensis TaxID=392593 RepID=A0A840S7L0_9BURK|nr:U32 family peptidase [Inhella inkyongensis]MBB5204996.1 collagenase-like PrtC family protease [Inhella inkyongensis]
MELTIGPLLYWWPRAAVFDFYAQLADAPVQGIVLGEQVCSRRNEIRFEDWLALARELRAAGKDVRLATLALVMSEAELRTLRRVCEQDEFAVEAGDTAALQVLARAGRRPHTLGPHLNIYNAEALQEHARFGADRWVAPVELSLDAVGRINPAPSSIATEVWGFGRLPLAFSARCFTARHHRLQKDDCQFRCRDDADGLLLRSGEGAEFLALNGVQTQSAALQCLIAQGAALCAAGVNRLRLSPCAQGFDAVIAQFDAVFGHAADGQEALAALRRLPLPGTLVDGFARRAPGLEAA